MKHQNKLNEVKYPDVTIEDVKACEGYENISDELAQKIVSAIIVYTEIIYTCFKEEKFEEQKAKVISMKTKANKKAA